MTPLKITAGMVAAELRRLADALEKEPETEMVRPMVSFYCSNLHDTAASKAAFLALARNLPRPLAKDVNDSRYVIEHDKSVMWVRALVNRQDVCTLVTPARPAVYDCTPLLSAEEEAQLEGAA